MHQSQPSESAYLKRKLESLREQLTRVEQQVAPDPTEFKRLHSMIEDVIGRIKAIEIKNSKGKTE